MALNTGAHQEMQAFSIVTGCLDFLSAAIKEMLHLRDVSFTQVESSLNYLSRCFVSIIYMFIFQVNIYISSSP